MVIAVLWGGDLGFGHCGCCLDGRKRMMRGERVTWRHASGTAFRTFDEKKSFVKCLIDLAWKKGILFYGGQFREFQLPGLCGKLGPCVLSLSRMSEFGMCKLDFLGRRLFGT